MERQLATIQLIDDLQPIPDADSIEVASILGWKVVVKKGEFAIGDKCVYFEIDSVLPDTPSFEFMRNKHFRVKTIKLRKQISQGLAIPFYEIFNKKAGGELEHNNGEFTGNILPFDFEVGHDVTMMLDVKKWDNANKVRGADIAGNFPVFIPKTDEMRLQSHPRLLEELYGKPYYISTKIDGQSATYYNYNEQFGVCSRNWELKPDENNVYWNITRKHQLESIPDNHYFQGEIAGPGIQGNKLGLSEHTFYVYNIGYVNANGRAVRFHYIDLLNITYNFDIPTVPILEVGDKFWYSLDDLLEIANNAKYINGKPAEGIVIRPQEETYSNILYGSLSFKVISPEYLLKNGE